LYLPLKKDERLSEHKCQVGLVSTLRWRTAVLIIKIGRKGTTINETSTIKNNLFSSKSEDLTIKS
jgi:hypothetical protein